MTIFYWCWKKLLVCIQQGKLSIMPLTFKRVTQISKRRFRSESQNPTGHVNSYLQTWDQMNLDLEEFPPLKKSVEAAGPSIRDLYSFGNANQDLNENPCFEEDRWNVYKERVRSKFCCQKSKSLYRPQMSMTPIYEKTLSSILEEHRDSSLNNKLNQCFPSSGLQFNFAPSVPAGPASDLKKCVSPIPSNSSPNSSVSTEKATGFLNTFQKSAANSPYLAPEIQTLKPNVPIFLSGFASQNRTPETTEKACNPEVRPVKAKSIHTMNEPTRTFQLIQTRSFSTISKPTDPITTQFAQQTPGQNIPLLSNTTWFLQDNISNQFGFNRVLSGVSPVFQQGNLYAECYDFPTVPPDAFHPIMPVGTPILPKKKEFEHMFFPYGREKCALRRRRKTTDK